MRKLMLVSAAALAAVVAIAPMSPAAAAGKFRINVQGPGTYVLADDGSAVLTGAVSGNPFGGPYRATLAAADGTLPASGVCEDATATFAMDGPRRKHVEIAATGTVCGKWVQVHSFETHRFTGIYDVVATTERKLVGTDGFIGISLITEGRSAVDVIDT